VKKLLKVILDTNVIVSSIWGGNPKLIIDLWKKGEIIFVVSFEIVSEYMTLLKRFDFPEEMYSELLSLMSEPKFTIWVKPTKHFNIIRGDAEDNKFLDCAAESEAAYIISGDKHLKNLKQFKETEIVSPKDFLKRKELSEISDYSAKKDGYQRNR